jgi:uncharacterized protein with FMN-binding domain
MQELMRRAAPGLAVAGAALSVVWLFDPALQPDATAGATTATGFPSPAQADEGDAEEPTGTQPGEVADPPAEGAAPGTAATPQEADGSDCSTAQAVTGDPVMTRWGAVTVRATFAADGSTCDVTAIAYPDGDPHSARLNAMAVPALDAAALEVGVDFDAISGATYTSEAYRASLQSILDQR